MKIRVPHGTPRLRVVRFTASNEIVRRITSRARVIMAIEKRGWPIIGRIVYFSTAMPIRADMEAARRSARNQCSQVGPGNQRAGTSQSMKMSERNQAPTRAMAPWAKLSVWVDL